MHRRIVVLLAFLATAAVAQLSYNAAAPLDPQLVSREMRGGVLVQNITYAGGTGNRVPAHLFTLPNASAPAAVLFMNWSPGLTTYPDEPVALANNGVTALVIDAPKQTPIDLTAALNDARRGIDLLAARKDLDARHIGFVGSGPGAEIGAMLASIEPRVRAIVLAGASANSEAALSRPHAAPVFFQYANNDPASPSRELAERLLKAAGKSATQKRYDSFNAAARTDRDTWLATTLGFTMKK